MSKRSNGYFGKIRLNVGAKVVLVKTIANIFEKYFPQLVSFNSNYTDSEAT
jgi:hypothetical protein